MSGCHVDDEPRSSNDCDHAKSMDGKEKNATSGAVQTMLDILIAASPRKRCDRLFPIDPLGLGQVKGLQSLSSQVFVKLRFDLAVSINSSFFLDNTHTFENIITLGDLVDFEMIQVKIVVNPSKQIKLGPATRSDIHLLKHEHLQSLCIASKEKLQTLESETCAI